jgi:ABC-2 type transport system permease protein
LDFTLVGQPGWLEWVARLSLTQVLRPFEQGLLSIGVGLGAATAIGTSSVLAGIWMPPGQTFQGKVLRSAATVSAAGLLLVFASQAVTSFDASEDRRNSFAPADQGALATLTAPLVVTVHLASEDPRYLDLRRNVLAKLQRVMPDVTIHLAGSRQSFTAATADDAYGVIELTYGARSETTRSTSPREILPILYQLAGVGPPNPAGGNAGGAGGDYRGYPLVANPSAPLVWYFGALPLLIALTWWWSRRPPSINHLRLSQELTP